MTASATVAAIDVIVSREAGDWPDDAEWLAERAALAALAAAPPDLTGQAELSVLLADDALVRTLNRDYRGKDKPTNVLSFPLADEPPPEPGAPVLLGDVVLAWETLAGEAAAQGKPVADHLRHLVVHGVLHLLGYDHEADADADSMERLEREVLAGFGVPDPYAAPGCDPPADHPEP